MNYSMWFQISFALLMGGLVWSVIKLYSRKRDGQTLSPLQILTLGVALAVWAMFIPVYVNHYDLGSGGTIFRPLLLALHNTFRVFILDGEFDTVRNALLGIRDGIGVDETLAQLSEADGQRWKLLSAYAVVLYVLAPTLTFTAVLSLFKNLAAMLRMKGNWLRTYYIMSELNEQSMALAESIHHNKKLFSRVVFTDVFERNEEADYELAARARRIRAICLKQDVTQVIPGRWRAAEYFLIGSNESENISQASKLAREFQQKPRWRDTKLFVFASGPESEYMVGSIADCAASPASRKGKKSAEKRSRLTVRRVDAVEKLIWNEMREMKPLEKADENGVVSVTLVGMGKYGIAFFKNLIWFCQACGYRLELNVVDKRKPEEAGSIRSVLESQCSELLKLNGCETDGEASYSVEFFEGVDAESGAFARLLEDCPEDPEQRRRAERLKRSAFVIVAMGDDDRNIRVAMDLRLRFDRLRGVEASRNRKMEQEEPRISAVVFDQQKTTLLLPDAAKSQCLLDYKSVPLNICFIGNLRVQYDYQRIYEPVLEEEAYRFHSLWVRQNRTAKEELDGMSAQELEEAKKANNGLRVFLEEGGFKDYELQIGNEEEERRKYERFEYFRKSSMARALHDQMLRERFSGRFEAKAGHPQICMCENCLWLKKTEHMRWNAYMRSRGYKKGSGHISRAKLHSDLVPWGELPWQTQIKD